MRVSSGLYGERHLVTARASGVVTSQIRKRVALHVFSQDSRGVVVATRDLDFGIFRMYGTLTAIFGDPPKSNLRIVRSMDEAVEWSNQPRPESLT